MGRPRKANKAPQKDVQRATRIRTKLRRIENGERNVVVTRDERHFLKTHEDRFPYKVAQQRKLEQSARPRVVDVVDVVDDEPPTSPASSPIERARAHVDAMPPEKKYAVDFSEPDAPAKLAERQSPPEKDESSCPFGKSCPHCRDGIPKKDHVLGKCGTTGRIVYEPMSEQGARFFAGVVLNGMAIAARILRPDHALIEPEDEDYEDMSRGVRMTIDRRMPQLSMIDDLAQVGFAFSAFGRRALFDPPPPPEKKA